MTSRGPQAGSPAWGFTVKGGQLIRISSHFFNQHFAFQIVSAPDAHYVSKISKNSFARPSLRRFSGTVVNTVPAARNFGGLPLWRNLRRRARKSCVFER